MGVYCYTLRKQTRQIDGVTIGRTAYAYKDHWDAYRSPFVARQHAAAERARNANPKLTRVIMGDWKYAATEPLPVFEISEGLTAFMDHKSPGPVVGYVTKSGGRYRYKAVDA